MEKLWIVILFASLTLVSATASRTSRISIEEEEEKEFNLTTAINTLFIAYSAFCDGPTIRNWTCGWCRHIPGVKFIDSNQNSYWEGETYAIVVVANKTGSFS